MTAVIVIDMQNDFFDDATLRAARPELVESINELIRLARSKGWPIVWVRQEFAADLSDAFPIMRRRRILKTIENTPGSQLLDELDFQSTDHEIIKKRYSPFHETDLDELLRSLAIEQVVLAGINTHACVRMAAVDAYQRDYEVVIPKDCVSSYDIEHHDVTLRYLANSIARVSRLPELLDSL